MSERTIVIGVTNRATALEACSRAIQLAKATDADVHLVYGIDERDPDAEAVTRRHAEGLLESLALSTAVPVTVHAIGGKPHEAIVSVARQVHADLIVVGNQGMLRWGRLTRATPARVLRDAPCSVLVVDTSDARRGRH